MTIFITDSFRLDLTHLNVRFSEKNTFFANELIKQHSYPSKMPRERNFIDFFNFMASDNSTETNRVLKGLLFRNDRWHDAEMLITDVSKNIEFIIYYSIEKLEILNTPLKNLPWGTLNVTNNIYEFAEDAITKDYPQTIVNFSKVYHPEKHKDYPWGTYDGFLNNHKNGSFQRAIKFINGGYPTAVMNEMVPYLYVKEIMRFIFSQINYTVIGDFDTNPYINKALWYHTNTVFRTNETFLNAFSAAMPLLQLNVLPGYLDNHNIYQNQFNILEKGAYRIKATVKGDLLAGNDEKIILLFKYNNQLISIDEISGNMNGDINSFSFEKDFIFNITNETLGMPFVAQVIGTVNTYNFIEGTIEVLGTKGPLYNEVYPLTDFLPDMLVGDFIDKVKETFKLTSVLNTSNQTIALDFFKNQNHSNVIDLSNYSQFNLPRKMNKSLGFSLIFKNEEILNLDKSGDFKVNAIGYTHFKIPIEPLPVNYVNAEPTVKHQEGDALLFFESNGNAHPFIGDGIVIFTRIGFIHYFLRQWLYQLLNSETVSATLYLPIYLASKVTAQSELWLNNNYYLVESINRENINKLFEKLTVKLFKLKSLPKFNLVIDGTEGPGGETFLPPTINIGYLDNLGVFIAQTELEAIYLPGGMYGNSNPSITVDLNASFSIDPQDLELSFGWELIASPNNSLSEQFMANNQDNSIVTFVRTAFGDINGDNTLIGEYIVRLTVYNTQGLFSTQDVTITAS